MSHSERGNIFRLEGCSSVIGCEEDSSALRLRVLVSEFDAMGISGGSDSEVECWGIIICVIASAKFSIGRSSHQSELSSSPL